MKCNIEFIRTILKLSDENIKYFSQFLFDVGQNFLNNFEEYDKIIRQFDNGKRQFLNRNYNNFVKKHRNILSLFVEKETLDNLIFTVVTYKETLKLVKYLTEKKDISDKMFECLNSLENLKIEKINFVDELPFAITCSETKDGNYHSLNGAFTDGKKTLEFSKQYGFTTDYILDASGANYIIFYSKNNISGLKDISVYIKNLEFDPNKLPSYAKLHSKKCFENIQSNKRLVLKLN